MNGLPWYNGGSCSFYLLSLPIAQMPEYHNNVSEYVVKCIYKMHHFPEFVSFSIIFWFCIWAIYGRHLLLIF